MAAACSAQRHLEHRADNVSGPCLSSRRSKTNSPPNATWRYSRPEDCSRRRANIPEYRRQLRVILTVRQPLPVCPDQRTSSDRPGWSDSCQQRTCLQLRHSKTANNSLAIFRSTVSDPDSNRSNTGCKSGLASSFRFCLIRSFARSMVVRNSHASAP